MSDPGIILEVGMFVIAGAGVCGTALANLAAGVWLVTKLSVRQQELSSAISELRVAIKELTLEHRTVQESLNTRMSRIEELGARLEERTAPNPR